MRFALTGLLLIGATACTKDAPSGTPGPAGAGRGGGGGAAPVSIAAVIEREMPVTFHAVGTVVASSTVDIRSQVTGELMTVGFTEGQDVKAGETLFVLDPRPVQAALNQAQAVLARDTAQAANADALLRHSDELLAQGLVARVDRDTLAASAAALHGTLAADRAAVENAQVQLQFTRITAPISGRTGALLAHPGALVRANDTTPLVTINQTSPIHVAFTVPSRLLIKLRADQTHGGLKVQVRVPGAAQATVTGRLGFIDNTVDPGTDTIRVKGTFENVDRQLWPGQYVDVTLQLSVEPHAIVIPTSAVQASQQGQFVYVLKPDQTVEARPVRVSWTDGAVTVIETGLSKGEQVVTDGQLRLTPGAKVTVKPAIGTGASSGAGPITSP
jgi:multidrug efflux system membrane fusion protein